MKRFMQDLGDLAGLDIVAAARRAQAAAVPGAETRSGRLASDVVVASEAGRCRDDDMADDGMSRQVAAAPVH